MTTSGLTQLHALGERIASVLAADDLATAQALVEIYLVGLETQFHGLPLHTVLNSEQQEVLRQFQALLIWIEWEKGRVEAELIGLSKAGRIADLYRQHTG